MANLRLTKTLEKELKKLAELNGFDNFERYLEDKIIRMVVNELTAKDVESTKQQIAILQDKLNNKRSEIFLELEEQKKEGEK